jgi:tRNA threonylcarbamoyl adenosine modification protein (Sua5/YciO/YrdC/YwlC family)
MLNVIAALRVGSVVAMPTDTVYGLAVDPTIPGATQRLFALKGRSESVALPVLVSDLDAARALVGPLPEPAATFASRYWPGPLTIVVERPAGSRAASFELGAERHTIGIRCPDHAVALQLLRATGPLAVTSANRHGEPPLTELAAVEEEFGADVAAFVDGGRCDGRPSTVIACTADGWRVLRAGPVSLAQLTELVGEVPLGAQAGPLVTSNDG